MRRAAPPKGPGGPRPAVGSFLPAALRAGVRGRADNGPCRGSASLIPSEARDQVAAILAFVDGDGACDIAECGHGAPTGNWIAVVIVAGGSFRRALGWFGGLLFGKAGMALLLEAAFAVLAKAVVFSLDRQLLVQTTPLSAPVVGPRRGVLAPADRKSVV